MFAALAQLVERRLGKAEVGSSNLLGSLNHEAFRNIREAFFRVTGNSCYVKGHERNTDAQRFCMEYVSFADQNHAPSLTDVRLEFAGTPPHAKKTHGTPLRRSFFIIKILNSMPSPVSVSRSHTREHLLQRTRSGNRYRPSLGSTRSYRTFPLRDGSHPPPHFRSQDRSVR